MFYSLSLPVIFILRAFFVFILFFCYLTYAYFFAKDHLMQDTVIIFKLFVSFLTLPQMYSC